MNACLLLALRDILPLPLLSSAARCTVHKKNLLTLRVFVLLSFNAHTGTYKLNESRDLWSHWILKKHEHQWESRWSFNQEAELFLTVQLCNSYTAISGETSFKMRESSATVTTDRGMTQVLLLLPGQRHHREGVDTDVVNQTQWMLIGHESHLMKDLPSQHASDCWDHPPDRPNCGL